MSQTNNHQVGILFTKGDNGYYIEMVSQNLERLRSEFTVIKECSTWQETQEELNNPSVPYNKQFLSIERMAY